MYDVVVIGGGIIGTSILRELSKYKLNVILLESDYDVSNGTTKANSAIVHSGYDAKPGTLMAKYNALGNPMFDKVCNDLKVPFKRIKSMVVAFSNEEIETLNELYNRGILNGIKDMQIISGNVVRKIEKNASLEIKGALLAKTAGIVGPFELAIAMAENACLNGAEILLNNKVMKIEKIINGYEVSTNKGSFKCKAIINAAGVNTDKINNMISNQCFSIIPLKGQYFVLDKTASEVTNHIIFQCPTVYGKGILVTPTVHGNILVGPDSFKAESRQDLETAVSNLDMIKKTASKTFNKIPFNKTITNFSGLRAESDIHDFIIGSPSDCPGFFNAAGIKSPGLSASPAIALEISKMVINYLESNNNKSKKIEKNDKFNPNRDFVIFSECSDEEKLQLIKKNKKFANIICRCELVTEAEIVRAIKTVPGATTVDGIKRRVRPGMGRCQGGFCGPKVIEILARELNLKLEDIKKAEDESYIVISDTK